MSVNITVRPSEIVKREECAYQRHLFYDLGIRSSSESCNLVFGSCVDVATGAYLEAMYAGTYQDPVEIFKEEWDRAVSSKIISYPSIWDADSLRETGIRLCETFPDAWKKTGLILIGDDKGPLLHRRLKMKIADNIILSGELDVAAMDMDGYAVIVDVKTPASQSSENFVLAADQLTYYDILLQPIVKELGLLGISKVGYLEGLKKKIPKTSRGTGPIWTESWAPGRTQQQRNDLVSKVKYEVKGILEGYHPKRSRMAYNTGCDLCDFSDYCLRGSSEGLFFPQKAA